MCFFFFFPASSQHLQAVIRSPHPFNQISNDFQVVLVICQTTCCFCCVFSRFSAFALKEKVNGAVDSWPLVMFSWRCPLASDSQAVISQLDGSAEGKVRLLLLPGAPGAPLSETESWALAPAVS